MCETVETSRDSPDTAGLKEGEASFRVVFQVLYRLATRRRFQFFLIMFFAFLSTGADLLQPLVYKYAIDDVAGLFVGREARREIRAEGLPVPPPAAVAAAEA